MSSLQSNNNKSELHKLSKEIFKVLNDSLYDFRIPFPFIHPSCSFEWYLEYKTKLYLFGEYLKSLKEEILEISDEKEKYSKSILIWDEFIQLAKKFEIPPNQCEKTAIFLRHIGIILHYRDALLPFKNNQSLCESIFLLPDM